MKKTANKRLKLKAETVAVLQDVRLGNVHGGLTTIPTYRTCPPPRPSVEASCDCEPTQGCTAVCGTQTCNVNCTIA